MKKTIIDLFEDSVVKYGAKTFLLEKKHRAFEPTTYAETKEQALEIGAGLAAAGIRPGDKVAILSEGCNAWITSELGVFYAGAVSVPLSVNLKSRTTCCSVCAMPKSGRCSYRNTSSPRSGAYARSCRRWSISSSSGIFRSKQARRRSGRSGAWAATTWRQTGRSSSQSAVRSATTTTRRSPTRRAPRPTRKASC